MVHSFPTRRSSDLLSHHLYSSPRVFVRELLQNGVDAITARADAEAPRRITVVPGPGVVRVTDTGVGLTESEMHELLATIGRSSKRDEFDLARSDFLGQFGIGLLSCFLVSDEIVVRSRSARSPEASTVIWHGRSDGTYDIGASPEPLPEPGTEVVLRARRDDDSWFAERTIRDLVTHYGALLSVPVDIAGEVLTAQVPPWRRDRAAMVEYCRDTFGFEPFDMIDLAVPVAGIQGVAFVLPDPANPATHAKHRVYLKGMLLSDAVESVLPEWAFFVRCVVDTTMLRPTASREGLYEDALLDDTREALGAQLRAWLLRLATVNPARLERFLRVHQLGVKAMALRDDEMLRLIYEELPFETSLGDIPIAEFRRTFPVVRFASTVDEFRSVAGVAAAHGYGIVNAGYTFDQQILLALPRLEALLRVEPLDTAELVAKLESVDTSDELASRPMLRAIARTIPDSACDVVLRRFDPASLPALYLADPNAVGREIQQAGRGTADGLWQDVLSSIADPTPISHAQFVLNFDNPLVRRLTALEDTTLISQVGGGLYVQALLASRQPLRAADTALMNSTFLDLIDRAIGAR